MTTASQIDAAMRNFAIDVAFGDQAQRIKSGDALRELIAAALAEARREGAEQMRDTIKHQAEINALYGVPAITLSTIYALPLPTGERQAVMLTDEQVSAMIAQHWGRADIAPRSVCGFARSIESAVLAANGMEVRRG